MEQGRVIDSVYGFLSGRDKSFREQILSIVDLQKDQSLNQLVHQHNPNAWRTGDDNPKGQVPHIQSSYCYSFGEELGLRGYKAAVLDKDKFTLTPAQRTSLINDFKNLFSINELINLLITDINQQDEKAERVINVDSLMKWAGDKSINNDFDSHTIFYDESNPEQYKDLGKPKEENIYKPFLSKSVALIILEHLFKNEITQQEQQPEESNNVSNQTST